MDTNNHNHTHNMQETVGAVQHLTDDTFVSQVLEADTPVLVDFKAEWCGPCKMMAPVFAQLAPQYTDTVKFAKLDVDESPGVASALQIQSIPTFMLFYKNNLLNMGVGAMRPDDLEQWISEGLERIKDIPADGSAEATEAVEEAQTSAQQA